MQLTQAKAIKEGLKHILSNVFEAPEDGPLFKALESAGCDDIQTMVTFLDIDIDFLTFEWSDKENDTPLSKGKQSLMLIF